MLARLVKRLVYGGTAGLRSYESACLERLCGVLPNGARSILEGQVAAIELVQRFSEDRMVTVHFSENQEKLALFPNRLDECRAARMHVRSQASRAAISVDVVFHRGRLSSIEYSRPPAIVSEGPLVFEHVEVLQDLLHVGSEPALPVQVGGPLLQRIQGRVPLLDILEPAPERRISSFLAPLGEVPADYAALLRETDGFSVDGWRFTGTKARRLLLHGDVWLVAETSECALCLREQATEPSVLYLDQIDDECTIKGASFVECFLEVLSEPARSGE